MYEGRHIACCTAISNSFDGDHDDDGDDDDGENRNQIVGERGFVLILETQKALVATLILFARPKRPYWQIAGWKTCFNLSLVGFPFEPFKLTQSSKGKPTRGNKFTSMRRGCAPNLAAQFFLAIKSNILDSNLGSGFCPLGLCAVIRGPSAPSF